ncbi:hypothetical protein HDV02_000442 [Globomyces sp. JEL0801]|nr:hypothetical protein HDV02_000442 [Globomyces sp. JEL0801]
MQNSQTPLLEIPSDGEIKLLNTERLMSLLPATTTCTFYKGFAPILQIEARVKAILDLNPWLAGRLRRNPQKEMVLSVPMTYNLSKHFFVVKSSTISSKFFNSETKSNNTYGMLVKELVKLERVVVKDGNQCVDKDEPLFRISIINNFERNEFAIVFSLSHLIADGYTFYMLYRMLDSSYMPLQMKAERQKAFEKENQELINNHISPIQIMAAAIGLFFQLIRCMLEWLLYRIILRRESVCLYMIDNDWVQREKKIHSTEDTWVSTNDVITSWLFKTLNCSLGSMVVNLRDRIPSVGQEHAGNYMSTIFYQAPDYATPKLIRDSITGDTFGRTVTGPTTIWTFLRFKNAHITSWTGFYHELKFDNCNQIVHIPIIQESLRVIGFVGILFVPNDGKLALLSSHESLKNNEGNLLPFEFDG